MKALWLAHLVSGDFEVSPASAVRLGDDYRGPICYLSAINQHVKPFGVAHSWNSVPESWLAALKRRATTTSVGSCVATATGWLTTLQFRRADVSLRG